MRIEELKALLERAYEEGWRGCLEMKAEVASRLANEGLSGVCGAGGDAHSSFSVVTTDYQNMVSPYYFYSTTTLPPAEIVRRDEVL